MKKFRTIFACFCAICMLMGSFGNFNYLVRAEETVPEGSAAEEVVTEPASEPTPAPVAEPTTQAPASEPAATQPQTQPQVVTEPAADQEHTLVKELTASDGRKYNISVFYKADSNIPDGAELLVSEVRDPQSYTEAEKEWLKRPEEQKTDEEKRAEEVNAHYNDYMEKGAAVLKEKAEDLTFAIAFDIKLKDPVTKVEYQPSEDVQVMVQLADIELKQDAKIDIIHFDESKKTEEAEKAKKLQKEIDAGNKKVKEEQKEAVLFSKIGKPEQVKTETEANTAKFDTDGFSVYVVTAKTQEQKLYASDGATYNITATYDYTASIPKDAQLAVAEIFPGDEAYDAYLTESLHTVGASAENVTFAKPLDIYFLDPATGAHIQPDKNVVISIELLDAAFGAEEKVSVVHFGAKPEAVAAYAAGNMITFANDEFSVYFLLSATEEEPAKPQLTITADSAEQVYDGNALTKETYTSTGLEDGDSIDSVTVTGSQTLLGTSENVPSDAKIVDSEGTDVTDKYEIIYVNGTLTVTWGTNPVQKTLTDFQGNLASYQITVNPDGDIINEGEDLTLKDTFSNDQSVIYSTIEVTGAVEGEYSYDYSGQTGTFTIPDGQPVTITYKTRVQGSVGEDKGFQNTAVLGRMEKKEGASPQFVEGASAALDDHRVITPTGTDIHGQEGVYSINLFVYPEGHMETGLEGAVFRLLDSNMRPMLYKAGDNAGLPITFSTDEHGTVPILLDEETDGLSLRKNTVYYLEMITAPYALSDGDYIYYQKDNTYYSFLITDMPNYTYGGVYSYYNGDVLKVRCYPESKGVNVTKRFSGNYELTEEQKNAITFILQKEDLTTESGWVDVESHTYAEFSYGSLNFNIGRDGESELEDNATYRVIEENALPEELEGSVKLNETVSITYQKEGVPVEDSTNEFFIDPDDEKTFSYNLSFTDQYIEHKLTITKMDEMTGAFLPGAVFHAYKASGGSASVASYTTDANGQITIRRDFDGGEYDANTLYYVIEETAPTGYILPEEPEKVYFYFSENSSTVPAGLPDGMTATDLSESYDAITIANHSEKSDVPVTVVWGNDGQADWPSMVGAVRIGLYKSVGGAEPVPVTDNNGDPMRVQLTESKPYDATSFTDLPAIEDGERVVYSVVEEQVIGNDGTTDLTSRFASSSSISGTGWYVVRNQTATSVKIQKVWLDQNGNEIQDTSGKPAVTYSLYRTTKAHTFTRDVERADLLAFLEDEETDAECVRTGLSISYTDQWTIEVPSLEEKDPEDQPYYYYALEDVPDNQEDFYAITAASGEDLRTLTIKNKQTPVTVVIKAKDLEKIYGDADPAYAFDPEETRVMEEGASIQITKDEPEREDYTAIITDPHGDTKNITFSMDREDGENAGTYTITPSGSNMQEGYRVLFETGTLTINKREVTVTAGGSKVYGDDEPALVTIDGLPEGEDASVIVFEVSREEGEDVGTYPITLTGETEQPNYKVTFVRADGEGIPYVFTISPAEATVTADDQTKSYGADDPELTASVTGLKHGDAPSVIAYDLTRVPGEDVGDYEIIPDGDEIQGNYTVIYTAGTLTISPAAVTIKAEDTEKTYGDPDPEWEMSIDGLQLGEDSGELSSELDEATGVRTYTYTVDKDGVPETLLTFIVSRAPGEGIGSYAITPSKTPDGEETQGNYTVSYETGTLEIPRAELVVSADKIVKAVGIAEDPLLTATVQGWKNGDEVCDSSSSESGGVITWTYTRTVGEDTQTILTFTLHRESGEDEGEYIITAEGGEEQSNYQVSYEPGTFGILSVLDIDVTQPVVDRADYSANPEYSYTATLDLTGTGLSEYSKNGFGMKDGVPTLDFTLPEDGASLKTLKVPGGAGLKVTQNTNNADYTTAVSLDGSPYAAPGTSYDCEIGSIGTYHEIAFTHSRISLPVQARASEDQTEGNARVLPGREGAVGIPDGSRSIDSDFADAMHSNSGYEIPTDKYYVYDHASLYTTTGQAIDGASHITSIGYDSERGVWLYKIGGSEEWADVPADAQIVLFYLPKFVCKIGEEKFYSIKEAVAYAVSGGFTAATVEMLIPDYSIRNANEAVTIPEGLDVTITTSEDEFEGEGKAVISRSLSNTAGHLFTNRGILTFSNIILDGKDAAASDALILNTTATYKDEAGKEQLSPNLATLTIEQTATIRNAKGNNGGGIFVKNGVVTVNGTLEDNAAQNGGAIYVEKGSLTINSSNIKGNTASYGGAIYITGGETVINGEIGSEGQPNTAPNGGAVYMTGGSLKVSNGGSLGNNTATNGGAAYMIGGTLELESGSAVANNTATNGGAVYLTGGTLAAAGAITGNTASSGGAIYQYSGTVNSTGSITGNSATSGGAVYMTGGTFNVNGGAISQNNATNGGAVFGGAGTFNVSGGTMQNNTAAQNGGAIYATNATVNIKGGSLSGNNAQNGGAVYMNSSTVAISAVEGGVAPTISGNTASVYGGAIYVNLGAVQYSGGSITGNSAVNGAAIFVNSGNGTISAGITGNTASEGGAVGVGNASARLYFKGGATVSGNTHLNASGDEPERNVYLDKDSDQVINVTEALQEGSAIGVYVPGDLNSAQVVKHGDVGGNFGAYTITTNVESAFKNDRFAELDAKYENNRLFWGAKLTYDFVYKKAFEPTDSSIAGQPYTATGGSGYLQVALDKAYYPHGAENNEYVIYDLINSMNLYNTYSGTMNTRAGNATNGAASVYAYTFANGSQNQFDSGLKFSDYLTRIKWNNVDRRWDFVKQNGEEDTTLVSNERRVVIIYSAPAYLTITNNNELGHTLYLSSLLVNGKNVTAAPPYGYATARNGATVATLQPLSADDLVLKSGESVKLLFPGAQGKNYTLNGTFEGAGASTSIPYTINGTNYTNTGTNVNISKGLKNNYDAEEIVFGDPLPICKIVDDGEEHTFSLLKDAVQYMIDNRNSGTAYTVEMLVDYLIPKTDAMDIPSGLQVTFTTSQDEDFTGSNKNQADEEGNPLPNRAILSRDVGNSGSSSVQCVVSPEDKTKNSTLTVTNLIFDGRAIAGTGNGGAISSRYCDVTIDNCEFKGYRAVRGGAIFIVRGGTADQAARKDADGMPIGGLKIFNSHFENCQSSANVDKAGGGAVWTTAKGLVISNCRFDKDCGCTGGSAQGGAVFHNISDDKTHRFKEFDSDPGNAYYEPGYSMDTKTVLNACVFDNVYALGGAGGAVETDAQDTEIAGCRFLNCYTNANGGGGALIAYARDRENPDASWPSSLTISDSEFINSRAENVSTGNWGGGAVRTTTLTTEIRNTTFNGATTSKNGAAICVTGSNASSLATFKILGCTFNDCNAAASGGAIYCPVKELTIGDYTPEGKEPVHTTFTNCIAGTHGGGAYHASRAAGSFSNLQNTAFDSCVARTGKGGGFFGESYDLTVQGNSTLFTNCTAQTDGGGICHNHNNWNANSDTTTMKLEGVRNGDNAGIIFRNCTAVGYTGGAVRANAKNVSLENVLMEGNTATTEGGGIWMSPAVGTSVIKNCEFTDNHAIGSDSKGGSIYLNNGGNILQFINSEVSDSSALNGGGIYQYRVKVYLLGGSIEGEATANGGGLYVYGNGDNRVYHYSGSISGTAGSNGGGVYYGSGEYHIGNATYEGVDYTGASIGSVSTDSEGNTVYTAVAGNDGGGIYQNDGSLNMNAGASIIGQAAGNGGGVYSRKTLNQNAGDISGSAANGGGVYKTNQNNYTLSTGTVTGTATGNGGAVYLAATTLYFNGGTIGEKAAEGDSAAVHSTATNGGGLYVAGGTVNVKNGTIAGAAATRNGGGLYVAGGTYNFYRGSIVRNVAGENGGGVYHGGGTFKMTTENNATASAIIGGSAENGNTADKGAGLFVADGQKPSFEDWAAKNLQITYNHAITEGGGIAVGGPSAVLTFKNEVQIQHNTMGADHIECNVYLDQDSNTVIQSSGLDALAYIGVYASDSQDNIHGQSGMPFGKYSSDGNLDHFYNDRRPFLYGMKGSNNLVIWSEFVCKITDGAGNLLFKTASGTPAVYAAVENVNGGALKDLCSLTDNSTPNLYRKDAETGDFIKYTGDEFQVQMLVEEYLSTQIKFSSNANGRKVKLTTASAEPDEYGFKYQGDPRKSATIKRGNNTWAMIYVGGDNGEAWTLTLENITFDGNNVIPGEAGAILRMEKKGKAVLDQNVILKNGNTNNKYDGGAVCLRNGTPQLTMNPGSQIVDCQAGGKAGGGIYMEAGTLTMNGGEITGCTATNGGGVYMTNSTVFNMNGGTITGNIATGVGGGIALNHTNARINFAGLCNVTGNTLSNGTRCNVQLNQGSTSIINAKGLDARSEIGIYTPSGNIRTNYGVAGKPFGTWSIDEDKLFCFINDVDTTLRGYQGSSASDKKIYWEFHPLLTVTKTVNSDWAHDREDVDFIFEVKLLNTTLTPTERRSITGMEFSPEGVTTVTLKAGESATAVFPERFDKIYYEVREIPTPEQEEDYTVTAEHNDAPYGEFTKPLTVEGQLGENIGTDRSTSLSEVNFINTRKTGQLEVSKEVVSSVETDYNEEFAFTLRLGDPTINKTYELRKWDASGIETQSEISFANGISGSLPQLKDGEKFTILGLPTDLPYTVQEVLTESQRSHVRTQVQKDGSEPVYADTQTGTIGESDSVQHASSVAFINNFLDIVCKIVNRSRELLYYRDTAGNLQPAIYSHLEDAFAQINAGSIRTKGNGTVSGQLRVEMVVPEYAMEKTAQLNSGKQVLLSTALTGDTEYPYNKGDDDGQGNTAKVKRGTEFTSGSMIEDKGILTIDKIVLDGSSVAEEGVPETAITAVADGGIINVANAVKLTINSSAVLQNSAVTGDEDEISGNGGAIYLVRGASLAHNGTIQNCSAENGGGVYAADAGAGIKTTGTIQNCSAQNGNGGAIYAEPGSTSVNLDVGTVLTGNHAKGNGGAVYSESNVILRGAIGGTETANQANTATGDGGGIYMGRDTNFTMYAGSEISGNRAANGGGLAAPGTVRIAGGTISKNTASGIPAGEGAPAVPGMGGGVYATETASLTISGSPVLTENRAEGSGGAVYNGGSGTMTGGSITGNIATQSGGAVYVADGKTFTMSGGSISGGNKSPEGAVSTGSASILNFSGNSVVIGNTGMDGTTEMNVFLGYDSNSIIRTAGLGTGANIGVYVTDGEPEAEGVEDRVDDPIYCDHGKSARNFGTYTGTNIKNARLMNFVNDRDSTLKGMNGGESSDSQYYIAWEGKGLQVLVSEYVPEDPEGSGDDPAAGSGAPISGAKFELINSGGVKVWTGSSNADGLISIPWGGDESAGGNKARFAPKSTYTLIETAANKDTVLPQESQWTLTIGRDNSVTWINDAEPEADKNKKHDILPPSGSGEKAYLGDIFGLSNDTKPTVTFDPNGGKLDKKNAEETKEEVVAFGVSELQHTYKIKENNPTWDSHVFKGWGTMEEQPAEPQDPEEPLDPEEPENSVSAEPVYYEYVKGEEILFYRGMEDAPDEKYKAKGDITLYAQWEAVVCKITDRNGTILYVSGSPAVYGTLEEGFAAYNTVSAFTYQNGSRATARRIEMLVGSYTLEAPVTVARGKTVQLTTAPRTDTDGYAYTGAAGTVSVITRGESCNTSMITNNANLTLTNITLDGGNTAVTTDGGIVDNRQSSAVLAVSTGATLRNSAVNGNGGAIHAARGTTVTVSGGRIEGNQGNGAGIYLNQGSQLNLSGGPVFNNNTSSTALPAGAENGGEAYTKARQDIFIAGYAGESGDISANSLVVNGNLSSAQKSIWVWAEEEPHYKSTEQFAKFTNGVRDVERTLSVFRNARTDEDSENSLGEPVTGTTGDDPSSIYWTGIKGERKVILRKIGQDSIPKSGGSFTVYRKGSSAPYEVTLPDGTKQRLSNLTADNSGVFWIGLLPYGIYFIQETVAPNGVSADNAGKWFCLIVDENGHYMSGGYKEATDEASKAAAEANARNSQ